MKISHSLPIVLLVVFTSPVSPDVLPPDESLPNTVCRWTNESIIIDGVPDEDAWAQSPVVTFFDATDGSAPRQPTEVRLLYNEEMLLLAYECVDDRITSTLTERDANLWAEETVELFACPTGDLRYYFEYEVNPLGALLDLTVRNNFTAARGSSGISGDYDWNSEGMEWAADIQRAGDQVQGWSVEMAIPFEDMEQPTPEDGEIWRIGLFRIDSAGPDPDEYTAWSPTFKKPAAFHHPQYFGFLEFQTQSVVEDFWLLR